MEALVFDEPRNELVDSTLPDVEAQDTKTEELVEQLTEEFGKVKNMCSIFSFFPSLNLV